MNAQHQRILKVLLILGALYFTVFHILPRYVPQVRPYISDLKMYFRHLPQRFRQGPGSIDQPLPEQVKEGDARQGAAFNAGYSDPDESPQKEPGIFD